ncbi:hypothetical protein M0R45_003132 [Rubus argutus]|uniref:Uncharacterized protein n=1 Tax=Rubus argutus TaxID=59490 RepID=A0AAW1WCF7_RUBAR
MASSPSSSLTVANRDGSPEDEAVLSVTRAYAQDALLQFQSGKFDQCLTALHECLKRKADDPKILHNVGLAEFYRDGCSDPKRLLEVLNDVKLWFSILIFEVGISMMQELLLINMINYLYSNFFIIGIGSEAK